MDSNDVMMLEKYACGCSRAHGCMCLLLKDIDGFMYKVNDLVNKHKLTSIEGQHLIEAARARLNTIELTN